MRNAILILALTALTALFTAGCAGPEQRLGNGVSNVTEFARLGEMQRSVEQYTLFDPQAGTPTGLIHGFDQSVYRTVAGAYQIVTFPAGNLLTQTSFEQKYIPVGTPHPDSYTPGLPALSTFQTDNYTGFSGGNLAPFIPGNRFSIFEN
jgi:putative exosortase-associated protein (TIGR04073 family)